MEFHDQLRHRKLNNLDANQHNELFQSQRWPQDKQFVSHACALFRKCLQIPKTKNAVSTQTIIRRNCNHRHNLKCAVEFNGYPLIISFVFYVVRLILYTLRGFSYLKEDRGQCDEHLISFTINRIGAPPLIRGELFGSNSIVTVYIPNASCFTTDIDVCPFKLNIQFVKKIQEIYIQGT